MIAYLSKIFLKMIVICTFKVRSVLPVPYGLEPVFFLDLDNCVATSVKSDVNGGINLLKIDQIIGPTHFMMYIN